jgi:hypothetical protein
MLIKHLSEAIMKYVLIILALSFALAPNTSASLYPRPLVETVQDSDVIVIGTLKNVHEYSDKGIDYGNGAIQVEEVIWGYVMKDQNLTLKWDNRTGAVCNGVEHKSQENQKGIWLLTSDGQGNSRADDPGSFIELEEKDKVINALIQRPVRLKISKNIIVPDEPIEISLIFRNPTKQRQLYPRMEYQNGYLYINSKIFWTVLNGREDTKKVTPLANKIVGSESLPPIIVEPGHEYKVTFNLRDFFDFPTEISSAFTNENFYILKISAKEFAELNQVSFYQKSGTKEP